MRILQPFQKGVLHTNGHMKNYVLCFVCLSYCFNLKCFINLCTKSGFFKEI